MPLQNFLSSPLKTSLLPPSRDYDDGIICIDTEQVRPQMACCYLVRGGDEYAFIECGTALSVPGLLAVLDARGIRREQVRYVMPTHVHLDHAGGVGLMMRELPQARLVAHPRGAPHLIDPSKLIKGASAVYGEQSMPGLYGEILPVEASRVIVADDGYKLDLGGRELVFMDAPGHARHHYVVWDAQSGGLFTGDVFGLSYREFDGPNGPYLFPTSTPVQFEPDAWFKTLDRMMALQPRWVFLTHYGRVGDLQRLAAGLRAGLGVYQEVARRHAQAPGRHAAIKRELLELALREARELGSPLPEAQGRAILEMDMELNAQGLEVWLDKQAA